MQVFLFHRNMSSDAPKCTLHASDTCVIVLPTMLYSPPLSVSTVYSWSNRCCPRTTALSEALAESLASWSSYVNWASPLSYRSQVAIDSKSLVDLKFLSLDLKDNFILDMR